MQYKPTSVIIFIVVVLVLIAGIVFVFKKDVVAPVEGQPSASSSQAPTSTTTAPRSY